MLKFLTKGHWGDRGTHFLGRPLGLVAIVLYEILWGMVEMFVGLVLIYSRSLIARELAEDPQDLFINWLISSGRFSFSGALQIGVLIVALGAVKVALGLGIWYRSEKIRVFAIIFFVCVGIFGLYHLTISFTAIKFGAEIVDLYILWYLWKVLPKHYKDEGVK